MSWLRTHRGDAAVRRWAIAFGALLAVAALVAIGAGSFFRSSSARAEVVPAARAKALIEATSGDKATQVQAVGAKAELINKLESR